MSEHVDATGAETPAPPGPDGYPVVGSTLSFVRDPFAFYERLAEYGDVVGYSVGGYEFATLLHPDHVERVLVEDDASYRKADIQRSSGTDFIENGLLLMEGDEWRRNRTLMQPMFFRERVEAYGDTMVDYAARTVDSWTDGEVIDAVEETSALTLDVLAKTLFDVDVDGRRDVIRDASLAVQERSDAGTVSAFLPNWLPTPANRRFRRATDDFRRVVADLVAERRDGGDDLLSLLVDAEFPDGSGMDEKQLRDHLITFLLAGHETSSLALSYALLLLAQHPKRAARLREEVDAVLDGERPTVADLPDLAYTESVVREAMRRYPPAYVLFRQPVEDVTVGGYRIAEGTNLTLPSFRVHNDPRFWDDPEAFRPERWEGERDGPEYAYFPFGGGPRHCIGMRFAMLELQLALATLAARVEFDLESDPDPDLQMGVTLRPADPIRLRVRKRGGAPGERSRTTTRADAD